MNTTTQQTGTCSCGALVALKPTLGGFFYRCPKCRAVELIKDDSWVEEVEA